MNPELGNSVLPAALFLLENAGQNYLGQQNKLDYAINIKSSIAVCLCNKFLESPLGLNVGRRRSEGKKEVGKGK